MIVEILSTNFRNFIITSAYKRYPYILQQIFSVFRFGKNRKHSQDLKGGRDDDSAQDSDFSQTHYSTSSKDQERYVCIGFYKFNLFYL